MTDEIDRLRQAFDAAELAGDADALAALLADDFRSIGEQGFVLDKTAWIGKFADLAYAELHSSEVEISRYDRAAVVRLVQRSRSTWQGQPMELAVRVGQTWVEQRDGWHLAAVQFSSLAAGQAEG